MTLRALVSLAFAAWIGSQFANYGTSRTAAAVTYVVILVVSVVLHEVAHAVVGKVVGAEVTGMRLGFGPRLTPAGSWLDLRPIVVAAHVTYVPPRGATTWVARRVARSSRSQLLAISSAGLVLHAVLIVVALALGLDHTWVRELAWANVLALASNAVPMSASFTSTTAGPNDGAHILALLRHRGAYVDGADPDVQELLSAYRNGGMAAAQAFLASLRRSDVPALRGLLAAATLRAGRYADAAALAAGSADPQRPWWANHLFAEAEAMAMLTADLAADLAAEQTGDGAADPARVDRAAAQAEAAQSAIPPTAPGPERAAVAHTVALTRLLQGRYVEARDICTWAVGATEGADRAAVLATMGWAELSLGERRRAEALLAQAMSLHRGPLVEAFARRVARTPV